MLNADLSIEASVEEIRFYRAMHYSATAKRGYSAVLRSHVVRLSVCDVGAL